MERNIGKEERTSERMPINYHPSFSASFSLFSLFILLLCVSIFKKPNKYNQRERRRERKRKRKKIFHSANGNEIQLDTSSSISEQTIWWWHIRKENLLSIPWDWNSIVCRARSFFGKWTCRFLLSSDDHSSVDSHFFRTSVVFHRFETDVQNGIFTSSFQFTEQGASTSAGSIACSRVVIRLSAHVFIAWHSFSSPAIVVRISWMSTAMRLDRATKRGMTDQSFGGHRCWSHFEFEMLER